MQPYDQDLFHGVIILNQNEIRINSREKLSSAAG